ncbi:lysine methyltransferase [Seiridium cupressi]
MKPQQVISMFAVAAVGKNSLGYMVDYGRCHWENFLGNFENPFCELSPSVPDKVSVAEPKHEEVIRPVATPFTPPVEKPVAKPVVEEEKISDPIPPPPAKANDTKAKSVKLQAQDLWPVATTCIEGYNRTEEFCIYSDHTFAGGRGVTILTTPSEALKIAKSPAFTQKDLYKTVKDFNAPESDKWHVEEVPNKGMGLVASRNLQTGEHIMSVSAAIMTDFSIWDHVALEHVRRMQAQGISYLPKHHQRIFLNLSTHDAAESYEERVYKIILTNAFDISDIEILDRPKDEQGVNFFTVFPEVSRMNHDCRPNAHYYWDSETFTQNVFATRPILAGEEITITYVDMLLPRDERVERLDHTWHFPCACTQCTQDDRLVKASDARIAQILDLQRHFADYSKDSFATPEMAETLISLYQQERLYSRMYEAYTYAAIEYNAVGRPWEAIKYARLAIQHGFIARGAKDEDSYELYELAEDPWEHWSFMMKGKEQKEQPLDSPITTIS